ncbi:hypothetical protein P4662_30380, partial [Priestia megaterium]|nr:hypothetical protein [Priestia megaterium]
SSRMTAKSNDVAEGMGYEKKRKPLSRKRTGKQKTLYNWTDTVVFMDNDRLERAPTSHWSSTRK